MAVNGIQDLKTSVYQHVDNNWTLTDVAYDNVPYRPSTETEYIVVYVDPADENVRSLGTQNRYHIVGEVVIPVYTEQGKGSGRNDEIADEAAKLFRGKSIDTIQFRGASVNRVGITDDGGWYRSNVRIEFIASLYQ